MEYNEETKTLTVANYFNEELNIPQETKIIIFEERYRNNKFNQKINNLPQSLTHLTFGTCFNKKVNNLPQNLTHLAFGFQFNKKVNILPKNLTHLTFGDCFNKKVNNFPKNITHLTLGHDFNFNNQHIVNLPKNIKEITLYCRNNLINNLSLRIEKVFILFDWVIYKKVENLPPTIKEIIIEEKDFLKYIKVPFGCIITIKKRY